MGAVSDDNFDGKRRVFVPGWRVRVHSRPSSTLASLLVVVCVRGANAQQTPDYKEEKNWRQVCRQIEGQPLALTQPTDLLRGGELRHCDETAFYYGLGEKPNYAAALQCGWFQRAHPQHTIGNMFYGPGVLTMLYANGYGVGRDYDLAIRFACENYWASDAEFAARIGHLEHLRDTRSTSSTFDLCDDITSGLSAGICTSVETRRSDATRAVKIHAAFERLPARARRLFASLQAAESAFEQARTRGEVDLSGTMRAALQLDEEAKLRDQFLLNLEKVAKGEIPAASDGDLLSLDRALNEIYQRIRQSSGSKWEFGAIKPEGIRDTERKWLSLVDSWIVFARAAYPTLSSVRVRAQLIRLRLDQLRSLDAN